MAVPGSPVLVRPADDQEIADWDRLVQRFAGYRVVHKRAWLESLAESRGTALYLIGERGAKIVGCWPGILLRKGFIRSFGSPPPGSQTASMGPVLDRGQVSAHDFVAAAIRFLETEHGINYIELISSLFTMDEMRTLGFDGNPLKTHILTLQPGNADAVLKGFKDSARRNVRRAIKLNLQARFEDDESFVDEVYAQMQEVFLRVGKSVSFGRERVAAFFHHMKASNNLVAISVSLPDDGPCIATGLFTIDAGELLLWQWAHRTAYRWYRPTEFMTWTVMQKAMEVACDRFDMMGGMDFKKKFGAREDYSQFRWVRSRYRWMTHGRHWAEKCYRWQQACRGRLAQLGAKKRPQHHPEACTDPVRMSPSRKPSATR